MHQAARLVGADLVFTPDGKPRYRHPLSGEAIPSVTEILRAVGVSTDFEELKASSAQRAEQIDYKRDLGTAVHADAHSYDDDAIKMETVHSDVLPYLEAWITFRQHYGFFPLQRERRLYSPTLNICGTLDAVGSCERERDRSGFILADIKTGDPESAAAQFQTALYQILWEEENPTQPIAERWSVELTPGRTIPYRVHPYTDWQDFQKARAFVTTYYAQAARRTA